MSIVLGGKKGGIIGSIIVIILGVGLIVGITLYRRSIDEKSAGWIHANAFVASYDERVDHDSDGDWQYMYRETIEYNVDGITYKKTSSVWTNIRPQIGSSCEIAYDPDNPQDCVLVSENKWVRIIFYAVGGVFAVMGVFAFIYTLIKYRKQ